MDLRGFLRDEVVPNTVHERVVAATFTTVPELWLLSSSGQSGLFAAQGASFTFAHFINPRTRYGVYLGRNRKIELVIKLLACFSTLFKAVFLSL